MLWLPSIDTDRDVSTGNTTTAIGADGPINAKYALKGQYQKTARWIFHRDYLNAIRKLRHGDRQYLWQPGLVADRPGARPPLRKYCGAGGANSGIRALRSVAGRTRRVCSPADDCTCRSRD